MLRSDALHIFHAAVDEVKPDRFMPRYVSLCAGILQIGDHQFNLKNTGKIIVAGGGKAAAFMASCLEDILGDHIHAGVVVTKEGHALPLKKIQCIEAGHPVPSQDGVDGAKKIIDLLSDLTENDLVICLISGGASALIADIPEDITLTDMRKMSSLLLSSGATIHEINTIRKHLSTLKGGQLQRLATPAIVVSLILSDVVGDPMDIIASGPTTADPSTFQDALAIIIKYGLEDKIPEAVLNRLKKGVEGAIPETPKPGEISEMNILTGSNIQALKAARDKAVSLGYTTEILTDSLEGEASEQAVRIVQHAMAYEGPRPACLLYGGETTVTIKGSGLGGRNQEFALASLACLHETDSPFKNNILILSAGTDGTDGPTDATGAIVDFESLNKADSLKLEINAFLNDNASYAFFEAAGGHIKTGPTHTNVMDIIAVLIK